MSGTTNPEPLDEQELVLVLNAVTAQVPGGDGTGSGEHRRDEGNR
jgi:hypothetical protein